MESKTKWLDQMRLVLRSPSSSAADSGIVKPQPVCGRRVVDVWTVARRRGHEGRSTV